MFSYLREYFRRKPVAAAALGGGVYAAAGSLAGALAGLKVGSVGWLAVLFGWPVIPIAALVLGVNVFGYDIGDWDGDRYDY